MNIGIHHSRVISASLPAVAAVIFDFDRIWPSEIVPAPRLVSRGLYEAGPMVWQEVEHSDRIRSFQVTSPVDLHVEHWFEAERLDDGTLLQHTVAGEAVGTSEAIWRRHIAPIHGGIIEALFDNVEAAVALEVER
jgi:hypothetical protein